LLGVCVGEAGEHDRPPLLNTARGLCDNERADGARFGTVLSETT